MSDNENEKGETIEVQVDPTKKTIVMDEKLGEYGNEFIKHLSQDETIGDNPDYRYVCTIRDTFASIRGSRMIQLSWSFLEGTPDGVREFTKEQLEQVYYVNNLDSMLDYNEPFATIIEFIFPALECIRKYYKSKSVVMDQDKGENGSRIYMKIEKESG